VRLYGFLHGKFLVSERADLTPLYQMIFRRLKDGLLDWRYRFPELCLIEIPSDRPDGRRSHELEKLRANLEQAHRETMDDLTLGPAPVIVLAYRNIYGVFPLGWPPWEFTGARRLSSRLAMSAGKIAVISRNHAIATAILAMDREGRGASQTQATSRAIRMACSTGEYAPSWRLRRNGSAGRSGGCARKRGREPRCS
jgi:hypothetical protein